METPAPISGRTHTDLYRSRGRVTNIGGRGGLNLTYLSPNGYSWLQIGVAVAGLILWTLPILKLGVPFLGWGGMSLIVVLGPPLGLAWAADRTLPHNKTLAQWVTTHVRHKFSEKQHYLAGKPATVVNLQVSSQVWTPNQEGIHA